MDKLIADIKKNAFRYFLAKILLLFVVLFLLDLALGTLLHHFYFRQKSGMLFRTTYAMEQTKADIIILGSSTARHNYDPQVFQKGLNGTAFNGGMDGNSIFYSYAVLRSILKRYKPKVVIYDFDATELRKDQRDYDKLSVLLPYYKTHPEIRPVINLRGPYEKVKMYSKIYPYNSMIVSILIGNSSYGQVGRWDIDGYDPLVRVWDEPIRDGSTFVNRDIDSNKISIFTSFIKDCLDANVKLYIVCSPLFIQPNYENRSVEKAEWIAAENNVRFIDFSRDSTFLHQPGLFADISHLNQTGATYFSTRAVDSIARTGTNLLRPGR